MGRTERDGKFRLTDFANSSPRQPHLSIAAEKDWLVGQNSDSLDETVKVNDPATRIRSKMAIYCPQGSGTLRQQLLSMHGIAWYYMVLHGIAW